MAALRCSDCGIDWPNDLRHYAACPSCEGRTSYMGLAQPIDAVDAMSMKSHYDFDRFLQRREAERQAEFDRIVEGLVIPEPQEAVHGD